MKKSAFAALLLALVMLCSCALAAEYAFNPEKPYDGVMSGEFNNVAIAVEGDTGLATYYLPEGLQPWANAVIVLTPDNTTAEAFADTEIGEQWKAVCEENKMAVAFLAPVDGTWNLDGQGADDGAIVNQLYFTMRSKSVKLDAPFSMDKTHTALVGYGEGGAAALLFGAEYATDFANITAVDATTVSAEAFAAIGEQVVIPFPADGTQAIAEMNVLAKNVPTPVWFIHSEIENALGYYLAAGQAQVAEANEYAETVYAAENAAVRIWVSSDAKDPATIWNAFAGQNKRFMGMEDGGRVEFVVDKTTGFTFHEEEINGETRRWITYVPSSYDGSKSVPVVMSIHGYTASAASMVEESRWHEIAEKEGFIVVYPQGMVRDLPMMGNVPCAMWLGGAFTMLAGEMDPMTDAVVLNTILDKTEAAYNVDKSRVYCTGHSNGSMMTFTLAANGASRFAAVAPIGAFSTLEITDKALLPVWAMCGEFDSAATPAMVEGNATVTMLQSWNAHNGVSEAAPAISEQHGGQWKTMTFENADGVPMVRFTNVLRTAHIYMPEQPQAIWYDFFADFTRGEDGTLYYEGTAVNASEYAADAGWYEPAPVEEAK